MDYSIVVGLPVKQPLSRRAAGHNSANDIHNSIQRAPSSPFWESILDECTLEWYMDLHAFGLQVTLRLGKLVIFNNKDLLPSSVWKTVIA